jgi:hypothetical protein
MSPCVAGGGTKEEMMRRRSRRRRKRGGGGGGGGGRREEGGQKTKKIVFTIGIGQHLKRRDVKLAPIVCTASFTPRRWLADSGGPGRTDSLFAQRPG